MDDSFELVRLDREWIPTVMLNRIATLKRNIECRRLRERRNPFHALWKKSSAFRARNALLCFASIGNSWSKPGLDKAKEKAQQLRVPVPETRLPVLGFVKSLVLKQLICGTIAGAVSSAAVAPFGFIRTKVIAGDSTSKVVKDVSRNPGISKLVPSTFSGWLVTLFIVSLKRGVQFVTYEAVKRSEERRQVKDPKVIPFIPREASIATLSGALSAVTSLLATYPFNTVADRMMMRSKDFPSMFTAVSKVLRVEGIRGLYIGLGPEMLRMVPNAAAEFYAYETLRSKFMDKEKNVGVAPLIIGAAAGAFSTFVTYPLELARKEISLGAVPIEKFNFSGTWQALRIVTAREGLGGLYRGIDVQLAQIVPSTALTFVVYEIMKRALVASNEERRDEVKDA